MFSPSETFLLFGSQHRTPDTFHLEDVREHVAMGTTPGNAQSISKKRDDNEDAAAWLNFEEHGSLALLADAHFGAESGHIALDYFVHHFSPNAPDLRRQLFRLHLEIDNEIRSLQKHKGRFRMTSATTLVSCLFLHDQFIYCSSGDSQILRLRNQHLQLLTPIRPIFLGEPEPISRSLLLMLNNRYPALDTYLRESPYHTLYQLACILRDQPYKFKTFDAALMDGMDADLRRFLSEHVDQVMPHFGVVTLEPGDLIVMASDGITPEASALEPGELQAILAKPYPTAVQTAEALLKETVGDDNLTVVIYRA